jgi:sarcosine reductase
MRLEIESIDIKAVQEGDRTAVKDGVLTFNVKELEALLTEDSRIASVEIDLVHPGERTRVVNLMDVVQPRCKIDQLEADFPGFVGKLQVAGKGRTRSLRGVTVLTINPETTRKYSALLDMYGPGGQMSRYSKFSHVCVGSHAAEGVDERDFENAAKIAGLKAAAYLARSAEGHRVDEVEVFDLDIPNIDRKSDLPKVAYYYQLYSPQHDHRGVSDDCFYGSDVRQLMPTIIHPNEVLDGGVVGAHTVRAIDTYSIQNHSIIKELYRRHGKDLIFAGVVCGVAKMEPVTRTRKNIMAANLVKNVLGADGVILTKIHGGLPHVDLAGVAEECEKLGVKTAVYIQPLISDGRLPEMLLFNAEGLDLIITVGATLERSILPAPDRIVGGDEKTKVYCPDPITQYAGDPTIDVEQFIIAGIHDHTGGAKIVVKEY